MKSVMIIPTGDEVYEGIILDTNSPKIMGRILETYPATRVLRVSPVRDRKLEIVQILKEGIKTGHELILTIGGSGGGGKYTNSLAPDLTHEAILEIDPAASKVSIFGYNGHLWSRIVVAKVGHSLIITLPGPQVEAMAGLTAAIEGIQKASGVEQLCQEVAKAVLAQYPRGGKIQCASESC